MCFLLHNYKHLPCQTRCLGGLFYHFAVLCLLNILNGTRSKDNRLFDKQHTRRKCKCISGGCAILLALFVQMQYYTYTLKKAYVVTNESHILIFCVNLFASICHDNSFSLSITLEMHFEKTTPHTNSIILPDEHAFECLR